MLLLLSHGSAKSLPMYDKEVNGDRAILFIEDDKLKYINHPDYCHNAFEVKEMLGGNTYTLWGHTILHYIATSTIL